MISFMSSYSIIDKSIKLSKIFSSFISSTLLIFSKVE